MDDQINGIPVREVSSMPPVGWKVFAHGQQFTGTLEECRAKVAAYKRSQPWHRRLRWRLAIWLNRVRDAWSVLRGDYADEEW